MQSMTTLHIADLADRWSDEEAAAVRAAAEAFVRRWARTDDKFAALCRLAKCLAARVLPAVLDDAAEAGHHPDDPLTTAAIAGAAAVCRSVGLSDHIDDATHAIGVARMVTCSIRRRANAGAVEAEEASRWALRCAQRAATDPEQSLDAAARCLSASCASPQVVVAVLREAEQLLCLPAEDGGAA